MKYTKAIMGLTATILLLSGSMLCAQERSAKIFLPDSAFDFGFFVADGRVVHSYPIINRGDDTLRIIKIKPGCGCTAAPLSKENLGPGDTAMVDVYFDSKRMTGLVKKNLAVLSNDPEQPLRELAFIAIVGKPHPYLQVKPEAVNLGRLSEQKLNKPQTVTLTNVTDTAVMLEIVDYSDDYLKVELEKARLEPGESGNLYLTLVGIPPDPKYYNFSATLSVNIQDIKIHLTIPAFGRLNQTE